MNKKQKINKVIKYIGWKALGALVFVAVAGTSIWALAAFTEPTAGPSSSVQDFAKNIMGANNSDNDFDSSSVTANSDGSVIERLESLENDINNDYSACFNVYVEIFYNTVDRPSCPSGFTSVDDGYVYNRYISSTGPTYTAYRACCLPRN